MRSRVVGISGFLLIACLASSGGAAEDALARFVPDGRLLDGDAEWVTIGLDRIVFGSGTRITLASAGRLPQLEKIWSLDVPATDGLVVHDELYFARAGESGPELAVVDLEAQEFAPRLVSLDPAPRGALRLAQMDDYLVVGEDGWGVRILQFPGHRHTGHHGHGEGGLTAIAFYELEEPIYDVAATLRTIFVATASGIVELQANVVSAPVVVREIPLERPSVAIDANHETIYLLTEDGLRMLDLSLGGLPPVTTLESGVRGTSLAVLGRDAFVAAGDHGLERFRDSSTRMATIFISVGDNFFSPPGAVNVNVQDTVQWDKPSTVFQHNVFSCNAAQVGCSGQTATETFSSGTPRTGAFSFPKTFFQVGNNPYVCQVHNTTMQGNIIVNQGGPAPPPGVPDTAGVLPPMRVDKASTLGTNLTVTFDTSCPNAVNHDLIYARSADLPGVLGGPYALLGSECAVGASPFAWNLTPTPANGDFLWWVLVADDGASVEGSWGRNTAAERNGPGLNGSSNQCGNTDKDLTNTCGQ